MISFLFTVGLCALTHFAVAGAVQMDDMIAEEQGVHVAFLSNGVKTYVQENDTPSQCCSLKVVVRNPTSGEEKFSFDGVLDSQDKIDNFFTFCTRKLFGQAESADELNDLCTFSCSHLPLPNKAHPQELAVIAVGNFVAEDIQRLIDKHFGSIVLHNENEPESISSIQIGQEEKISKGILQLFYPNPKRSIVTFRDLKETWKHLILQELFQQRLERCSKGVDEAWVHPHHHFFYPVNGFAFVSEASMENLLSFLLWQVESIRNDGFFEDEFYATKIKLINQLQYLAFNASKPDHAFLASYYADQFLLSDRCLNYHHFLDASVSLVQEIASQDIFASLDAFFANDLRQIRVMHPIPMRSELLTKERVEELISRVETLASFYRDSEITDESIWPLDINEASFPPNSKEEDPKDLPESVRIINEKKSAPAFPNDAKIIKANHAGDGSSEPFYGLPLNDKEKRFIASIVTTMADKNIVQLVFEKGELEKKGKKIHHVHPLRFVGYILSTPKLKSDLKIIKKSSFKWDAFIDGFSKRMKEELSNGNMYQHVPGFAAEIGSTPDHVNSYIHKKDFEGLVRSML